MKKFSISSLLKGWINSALIQRILQWSKTHSLPGLSDQPVYDILSFIYKELQKDRIITRANSISFSFFMSLFPTILAFFTLIPIFLPLIFNKYLIRLLPSDADFVLSPAGKIDYVETIINQIKQLIPNIVGKDEVLMLVYEIVSQPRAGLFSFGFMLALYFASNGMMSMMNGFRKKHTNIFKKQSMLKKRLVAIGLLLLLSFYFVICLFCIILINQLGSLLPPESWEQWGIALLRNGLIIFNIYFSIATLYRYGVPTIVKTKIFSTGATVATTGSVLATLLIVFYVSNFPVYNKLYGSIGTIIVIMIWIQINSVVILIGHELNASIVVNRQRALKSKEEG